MGCKGKKGKRGKRFVLALAGLFLVGLLAASCTPEQDKAAGDTLTTTGQVLDKGKEIIKYVPVPGNEVLVGAIGGVAAICAGLGGWLKSRSERKKKKAYLAAIPNQVALDKANKKIYGKKFDAVKSAKPRTIG